VGALLAGVIGARFSGTRSLAAARNAVSRRLEIPGVSECLYTRAEPRRNTGDTLPYIDAWLIESSDNDTIDALPGAFRTAYTEASADSSRRTLVDTGEIDLDETYGDDSWASEGTYIDPSNDDAAVGVWSALHIRANDSILTLCSESNASILGELETIARAILDRKIEDPADLLPSSADLPRGLRITDRAITIQLGDG
jgi:hypothetical protein